MAHIVVTGASGFVGRALMSYLYKLGIPVQGLSRKSVNGLSTVFSYSDLLVPEDAILVHLAQSSNTSSLFDSEAVELCQTLSKQNWKHIVYVSSAVVYGDAQDYHRSPDEVITATSDYMRVKLACEQIFSNVGGTSLRFANLYGPGMSENTVLFDILKQVPGEGPLRLRNLKPVRDFFWIEDAVRCIVFACRIQPGRILNAGSGNGISIGDAAHLALRIAGERDRPVIGTSSGSASCLKLDITNTQTVLGWSPEVDLYQGLSSLICMDNNEQ
jgi:nucleoside-diphosphate-sugar epimerase